ncbi:hypothetical protein ACTXT7_006694 [Hymenolepis weldensis]
MELISRLFSSTWLLLFSLQCEFICSLPQLSTIDLNPIQQTGRCVSILQTGDYVNDFVTHA